MKRLFGIWIACLALAACQTARNPETNDQYPIHPINSSQNTVAPTPTENPPGYPPPLSTDTPTGNFPVYIPPQFTPWIISTPTPTPVPTPIVAEIITSTHPFDAQNIEIIGHAETMGAQALTVKGDWAYIANKNNALSIIDLSKVRQIQTKSNDPGKVSGIVFGGGQQREQVSVAGNYVFWAKEVAWDWDNRQGNLQVVDVSNPIRPKVVGDFPISGYDLQIAGHFAYVVNQNGLHILDISDPVNAVEVGYYQKPQEFLDRDTICQVDIGHLAVDEHYAYMTTCAGLRVIDIGAPTNPKEVKLHPFDPFIGAGAVAVKNGYIYMAWKKNPRDGMPCSKPDCWDRGMMILKIMPSGDLVETGNYLSPIKHSSVSDIAIDSHYAYLALGDSGVKVIDISNPAQPIEVGYFDSPGFANSVTIVDGLVYLADFDQGIWIFKTLPEIIPTTNG